MSVTLIVVMAPQVCTHVQMHPTSHYICAFFIPITLQQSCLKVNNKRTLPLGQSVSCYREVSRNDPCASDPGAEAARQPPAAQTWKG